MTHLNSLYVIPLDMANIGFLSSAYAPEAAIQPSWLLVLFFLFLSRSLTG